ncbi:MAG: tyrosine-type recombinase/integrase [Acidimicrobiales bacterium]
MRGSKRKLRPGVWELRVSLGKDPATGKYRQISKSFHGPARAADDALRDLVDKYGDAQEDGFGATFGQLLDRWLDECERMDLSPTTMRTYRAQVKQTIRPRLGKVVLTRLTPKHLDDLYRQMKEEGRSPKTIRNHHAIISSALHQGVRWEWVRENVADKAKPPRVSQRRVKAPSVEAVRSVIEAAEDRDPRLAPLLMLAALTGLRRGELCALRWTDVDFERGELDVSRSIVVIPGGLAEKSTKTDRFRMVALDEVGVALLTRHRANVDAWARQAEATVPNDAYVFSHAVDGSKPFRPDNVTGFFTRVRDSLGLHDVRLHDLRHFTATQLIGAGVDVRTVAGHLGHSDPSVTLRVYSHALEERDRAAAEIMGRVLVPTPPAVTELETG